MTHHVAQMTDGAAIHFVRAGADGEPALLVHGFPESWWVFHRLVPLLAQTHHVVALDLRGFGDSTVAAPDHSSDVAAEDLHELVQLLGVGPVHVVAQDLAGASVLRWVTRHPQDVRSLTAIEMGLPGFGLEALADVTHGGSWHIGALTAPGVPEAFLAGREQQFLQAWFAVMATPGAVTEADVEEFARGFARDGGWRGAAGLYRSILSEGEELRRVVGSNRLQVPVLAVGGGGGAFTEATARQVADDVRAVVVDDVGHHVALEAPDVLVGALKDFWDRLSEPSDRR